MTQNNQSEYLELMDAAWKHFSDAHKGANPVYCIISDDVWRFLDKEQISFACTVVVDSEMPDKTMCLIHAAI